MKMQEIDKMRKCLIIILISLFMISFNDKVNAEFVESVVNGGFEFGDFTGWTKSPDNMCGPNRFVISVDNPYSGNYSAKTTENYNIYQYFEPISGGEIQSATVTYKTNHSGAVKIIYDDYVYVQIGFSQFHVFNEWNTIDLVPYIDVNRNVVGVELTGFQSDPPCSHEAEVWFDNLSISYGPIVPIADAGEDIIASGNETIVLDGSASYDPDGTIDMFEWIRMPDDISICNTFTPECETVVLGRAEEVIQLKVTDSGMNTATDEVTIINHRANLFPPEFISIGGKSVYYDKKLDFQIEATDPEEFNMRYSSDNLPEGASVFNYREADVNNDGMLNLSDLAIFAAAYESEIGEGNYNPDCDFNSDGYINDADREFLVSTEECRGQLIEESPCHNKAYFYWKPQRFQIGTYTVAFSVFDGFFNDSEDVQINVRRYPKPPPDIHMMEIAVPEGRR